MRETFCPTHAILNKKTSIQYVLKFFYAFYMNSHGSMPDVLFVSLSMNKIPSR